MKELHKMRLQLAEAEESRPPTVPPIDADLNEALTELPTRQRLRTAERSSFDAPRFGTALHEASHAIIATVLGMEFSFVTVIPSRELDAAGHIWYEPSECFGFRAAVVHAAGVASHEIFGNGKADELWRTKGRCDFDLLREAIDEPDATFGAPRVIIALTHARALIKEFRDSVVLLAVMLMRFGTLDAEQVYTVHDHAWSHYHAKI